MSDLLSGGLIPDRGARGPLPPILLNNDASSDVSDLAPKKGRPIGGPLPPVEATDDVVKLDPIAQSVADLQAIIAKLKDAKGGAAISEALKALSDFIDNNTNASFAGSTLDKLGDFVDNVLSTLEESPDALGGFVSLNINASFAQQEISSQDYYQKDVSFSFSLSFDTKDTHFSASVGFAEQTLITPDRASYRSLEYARASITTTNLSVEDNPALAAFAEIAGALLGSDAPALLGPPDTAEGTPTKPLQIAAGNLLDRLRAQFKQLNQNVDVGKNALEALAKFLDRIQQQRENGLPITQTASA